MRAFNQLCSHFLEPIPWRLQSYNSHNIIYRGKCISWTYLSVFSAINWNTVQKALSHIRHIYIFCPSWSMSIISSLNTALVDFSYVHKIYKQDMSRSFMSTLLACCLFTIVQGTPTAKNTEILTKDQMCLILHHT